MIFEAAFRVVFNLLVFFLSLLALVVRGAGATPESCAARALRVTRPEGTEGCAGGLAGKEVWYSLCSGQEQDE